jgi:hypothetical protein
MALLASPFRQGGLKVKRARRTPVGGVNRMERPLLKQPVARRKIYAGGVPRMRLSGLAMNFTGVAEQIADEAALRLAVEKPATAAAFKTSH